MPHRILTVDEVVRYLRIEKAEIERMSKRDEIPCLRSGSGWAFRQMEIDAWASKRLLALHPEELTTYHDKVSRPRPDLPPQGALMPGLARPEWMESDFPARTKPSVLREMTALAERTGLVADPQALLAALDAREKMASTAVGGGVALLHPPHHEPYQFDRSFAVLARTRSAIPFGAPDGSRSDLFFLVCTQDDQTHLHVLSRVAMMCHSTSLLLSLREAANREEMFQAVVEAETQLLVDRAKSRR